MLIKKELLQLDSNTEVQFKELERSGEKYSMLICGRKNGDLHARFSPTGRIIFSIAALLTSGRKGTNLHMA